MDEYYYRDDEMRHERRSGRGCLIGGLITILVILLVALALMLLGLNTGRIKVSITEKYNMYEKIDLINGMIDEYYLDEVDEEHLKEQVYKGFIYGLDDPYSEYYTESELTSLLDTTSGAYAGIGAQLSQNMVTGIITITNPFDDSPAQKAGLQPGDILVAVDGTEITDQDLSEIVTLIKGEPKTEVILTVLRGNETLDITIIRDHIEVDTVDIEMLDEDTGYLSILEFDSVTIEQFKQGVEELQKEGMENLVVDLRDNPGGNVASVIDILDQILPEGLIMYTEDKYENRQEFRSDKAHALNLPMAVLVNEYSASASEIFAGAIKDFEWGTLVGTTTYGKGIIQKLFPLGDGTAIKLTVAQYYTPDGHNIHDIGITPDVEVELPEDVYEDGILERDEDTQLQKALEILNGTTTEGSE